MIRMRCIFIYNPVSGRGKVLRHLNYIEETLKKKYDEVVMYRSKSSDDIKKVAYESCKEFDSIIFSGGDGTFNDIVCGVSKSNIRPPLGYIPLGTGNDNSRNLKIPRNVRGALKVILDAKTIYHDIGKINDSYFVYVVALGACTGTPYTTKQKAKKILGRLAYAQDGINEFFSPKVKKVRIHANGSTIDTTVPLILIMNTVSVGGMPFNRYGHLNDGKFDVVLINNGPGHGRLNMIGFFILGLLGFRRGKRHSISIQSDKFVIEVDNDSTWCVDGEKGPSGPITIENLHNHIRIFAPKRKAKTQKNI